MKTITIKKTILYSLLFLGIHATINAQNKTQIGASVNFHYPIGDFKNLVTYGFGLNLNADYAYSKYISFTGSIGYTGFKGAEISVPTQTINGTGTRTVEVPNSKYYPVLVGAKLYFLQDAVFISAQTGLTFVKQDGANSTDFTLAPGIGFNTRQNGGLSSEYQIKYFMYSKDNGFNNSVVLGYNYFF
jgi:hypothetical protein